jgi:hypothetical protein
MEITPYCLSEFKCGTIIKKYGPVDLFCQDVLLVTIGGIVRGKTIYYQSDLCLLEVDRFSGINFSAISWAIIGALPPHRERAYPARKSSNSGWWASIATANAQDRKSPGSPQPTL